MSGENKLWGGRFAEGISDICREISESISFDHQLYEFDIEASLAHVKMLAKQNIISREISEKIIKGLGQVLEELRNNKIEFKAELEDIHTHVEKRLIELIGEEGKFLHTGRSRNDQVAVDTHLYLKSNLKKQREGIKTLLTELLSLSEKNKGSVWAGYTHLQIAQPVLLGHYLMAYFWKFNRDLSLLDFALNEASLSPLGAAAMGGASYPLDREFTASELGFSGVYPNSMDAVSNRDYQLSYHFFASRFFIHISRFCEDMILYSSTEFSYVKFKDRVTTGSSIMPQKKNPDIAELLRGKSSRVIGNLNALMVNLKGLPMTYNRDLQEDKISLFDNVRQVNMGINGMIELLRNVDFKPEKVRKSLREGFSQATDIADYLVSAYQVPFRKAHEMTGQIVLYCENNQKTLDELSDDDFKSVIGDEYKFPKDLLELESCINRKQGTGSTSAKELDKQLETARGILKK